MHDTVTLVLRPAELAFLIRCLDRELVEYEESSWRGEEDPLAVAEANTATEILKVLRRVEQEQAHPF